MQKSTDSPVDVAGDVMKLQVHHRATGRNALRYVCSYLLHSLLQERLNPEHRPNTSSSQSQRSVSASMRAKVLSCL